MKHIWINPETKEHNVYTNQRIADFLEDHLDQFGDKNEYILKCIEYALDPKRGGLVLLGLENNDIIGAVIVNSTGMYGYIPSNILVYIAVHRDKRGKGYGKQLMKEVLPKTEGGVALHVEPDNPAKYLYEKLGFTNKYLEMRYVTTS